jgi:hypothetical protein
MPSQRSGGFRVWGALGAWCVGSLLGLPALALAQQSTRLHAYLVWQRPAAGGCITAAELEASVEELLERDALVPRERADSEVRGSIALVDGRWLARLSLVQLPDAVLGTRELEGGGDCAELNRALTVVVATLLDDSLPTPPATSPAREQSAFGLGLFAGGFSGMLPQLGFDAGLLASLIPPAWPELVLRLSAALPVHTTDGTQHGADFQLFAGSLAACPRFEPGGPVSFALCGGAQLSVVRAQGRGLDSSLTPSRLLVSALLETAVSFRLFAHFSLRLSAALTATLNRPTFYFEGGDGTEHVLFQPALFGAALRLAFIADAL